MRPKILSIYLIQKKARRELRLNKYFTKKNKLLILNDDSIEFKFIINVFDEIFNKNLNIKKIKKIYPMPPNYKLINHKLIIPWSLDREINEKILCFFENKDINVKIYEKNILKLFKTVSEDEMKYYLTTKKIRFKNSNNSNNNEFVESLEKLYPGSKNTLLKSLNNVLH
ncbi:MAG: hypothetical protein QXG00_00740 [Candidatus Woesearchaeota archaeon]